MERAQKNEQKRSENSTNSQALLFLLICSKEFPWDVRAQYWQRHSHKMTLLIVQLTKKIPKNGTVTIFDPLELSPCNCMESGPWERNFKSVHRLSTENWRHKSSKFSRCLYAWCSNCGRLRSGEHLPVGRRLCGWSKDWRAWQKKCWETIQRCSTITSKQSHFYVFDIKVFFEAYWCPPCDTFSNRTPN